MERIGRDTASSSLQEGETIKPVNRNWIKPVNGSLFEHTFHIQGYIQDYLLGGRGGGVVELKKKQKTKKTDKEGINDS